MKADSIVRSLLQGDVRSLAKAITLMENDDHSRVEILKHIYPHTGKAYVIGVTGPPGGGKSTLIDALTGSIRSDGLKVGIIAVDPSSPFTGGALLGDRIRMVRHSTDPGVFIRSMSSRGHLGGLSRATSDAVKAMDAFGMDVIVIETVGAGQAEVDVVRTAHTSVLVVVPGMGDEVQVLKAGVMEIADVFAVNKADRPEADRLVRMIGVLLEMARDDDWTPPVIRTVASEGSGIDDLKSAIWSHRDHLELRGLKRKRNMRIAEQELLALIEERARNMAIERLKGEGRYEEIIEAIATRALDPYSAAEEVLKVFSSHDH